MLWGIYTFFSLTIKSSKPTNLHNDWLQSSMKHGCSFRIELKLLHQRDCAGSVNRLESALSAPVPKSVSIKRKSIPSFPYEKHIAEPLKATKPNQKRITKETLHLNLVDAFLRCWVIHRRNQWLLKSQKCCEAIGGHSWVCVCLHEYPESQ